MIGTLIDQQSDEMKKIAKEMEEREKEIMESSVEGRRLLMRMRMKSLDDELRRLDDEENELDQEMVSVDREMKEMKSEKEKLKRSSRGVSGDEEKLTGSSRGVSEDEESRKRRCQLVDRIEKMRKEKSVFKSECREKKRCLEEEIDRARSELEKKESGLEQKESEPGDLEEVQRRLGVEERRVRETQVDLGTVCRDISRLQRRLDDIPSRSELNQYQRRFVELYDQSKCRRLLFFNHSLISSLYHSLYSCYETYRNEEILHSIQSTR